MNSGKKMSSSLAGHSSSSSRRRASSSYNGAASSSSSANINALYEFLEDAELQHHYLGLRNVLRVQSVAQLRNILEDDLVGIGMSKSEALRLRVRASSAKVSFRWNHINFMYIYLIDFPRRHISYTYNTKLSLP